MGRAKEWQLVSMNLSKQGLTPNSKVQVSVGDDREVKAARAQSAGPITFSLNNKKKTLSCVNV